MGVIHGVRLVFKGSFLGRGEAYLAWLGHFLCHFLCTYLEEDLNDIHATINNTIVSSTSPDWKGL
jgi:hypothetical protein